MRALAFTLTLFLGPATLMVEGRSELEILRARCSEQERQIRTLETDIENLHSHLALERRRARGIHTNSDPAPSPGALKTCTVATGDTLSSIARRYGVSADTLMKINGISDPTRLRIGQKLTLPAEAESRKISNAPKAIPVSESGTAPQPRKDIPKSLATTNSSARIYSVERGDTLYGIARRHRITVNSLRKLNPEIADKIVVGQKITVTGATPPPRSPANPQIPTSNRSSQVKQPASKPALVAKTGPGKISPPKTQPISIGRKKAPAPTQQPSVGRKDSTVAGQNRYSPKSISSVFVSEEVSFGDFAKRHGTTPEQLNALNGWDFRSSLVLAKGSEIYVPDR